MELKCKSSRIQPERRPKYLLPFAFVLSMCSKVRLWSPFDHPCRRASNTFVEVYSASLVLKPTNTSLDLLTTKLGGEIWQQRASPKAFLEILEILES